MVEVLILALFIGIPAALILGALGAVIYRRGESFKFEDLDRSDGGTSRQTV